MTDKKEIIVHGVDVSECEKLAPYNGYDEETKCNPSCCQNSPNCMYKQLKRKEQECEKLQSQLNANNTIIDRFLAASGKSKDITLPEEFEEVFEDIEQTYSECEELKEWQEANKATGICETCTHKTLLKNDELRRHIRELDRLNAKYKQTLDKIEKLTSIREVHGLTDTEYVENFRLHQERILDTINKAKE